MVKERAQAKSRKKQLDARHSSVKSKDKLSEVGGSQETVTWSPGGKDASKEDKGPLPCLPEL